MLSILFVVLLFYKFSLAYKRDSTRRMGIEIVADVVDLVGCDKKFVGGPKAIIAYTIEVVDFLHMAFSLC